MFSNALNSNILNYFFLLLISCHRLCALVYGFQSFQEFLHISPLSICLCVSISIPLDMFYPNQSFCHCFFILLKFLRQLLCTHENIGRHLIVTLISSNKGKARRGVADGGPDDDGDYATLRELPLITSLDPADDSTSEENKVNYICILR